MPVVLEVEVRWVHVPGGSADGRCTSAVLSSRAQGPAWPVRQARPQFKLCKLYHAREAGMMAHRGLHTAACGVCLGFAASVCMRGDRFQADSEGLSACVIAASMLPSLPEPSPCMCICPLHRHAQRRTIASPLAGLPCDG